MKTLANQETFYFMNMVCDNYVLLNKFKEQAILQNRMVCSFAPSTLAKNLSAYYYRQEAQPWKLSK